MMMMRAALFFGTGDVRVKDVAVPEIEADEVLLKVGTALTCGSDFKAFRQGHPILLGDTYPAPFGHEVAGTIAKIGSHVSGHLKKGMRVVAANSAPCDRCFFCLKGQPNLCDHLDLLNGAYAQYIRIPAQIVKHNLYEIPDSLDFFEAALSEPLACAVHAYHRLGIQKGDTVAILGCGIMGLLLASVAVYEGARILAIGRNDTKLDVAREIGAEEVVNVKNMKDPLKMILAKTPSQRGMDFVVEAIGNTEAWDQAFHLARKGGTVCFFGGCKKGSRFSLDTHRVHYQEVTVRGVFHHTPEYFAKALDYLARGVVNPRHFVKDSVPLDEIPNYFEREVDRSPFKAAIYPNPLMP